MNKHWMKTIKFYSNLQRTNTLKPSSAKLVLCAYTKREQCSTFVLFTPFPEPLPLSLQRQAAAAKLNNNNNKLKWIVETTCVHFLNSSSSHKRRGTALLLLLLHGVPFFSLYGGFLDSSCVLSAVGQWFLVENRKKLHSLLTLGSNCPIFARIHSRTYRKL